MTLRSTLLAISLAASALLAGCGTTWATMPGRDGDPVMLLGHDPVAYFTEGRARRGQLQFKSSLAGRTYFFASEINKNIFDADPPRYEPQYAGFCSSGAAFGVKLGSDPTEWRIEGGRLFIFGDVVGRTAWELDAPWNIERGDRLWPEAKDRGWRAQSLARYANKVDWYKTGADIQREYAAKNPGKPWPAYDPGGMVNNLFLKAPGWRAREGFGQPALGMLGVDPCPPACPGQVSQGFTAAR